MLASPGNNSYLDEEEVLSLLPTDQLFPKPTSYIERFINNTLASDTKNYYLFERQKEKTLSILRRESKKFGDSFILKYPRADFDKSYLPIHSLIALDHLGVIDLQEISIEKDFLADDADLFAQKIIAKIVLSTEVISGKQSTKPKFSFVDGIFHFKDKDILISKNQTHQRQMLETILKDPNRLWSYDEIWIDWGENTEDYGPERWRDFYQPARNINKKIAEETLIKDFLIITTNSVNISKKYL